MKEIIIGPRPPPYDAICYVAVMVSNTDPQIMIIKTKVYYTKVVLIGVLWTFILGLSHSVFPTVVLGEET